MGGTMKKKRILAIVLIIVMLFSCVAYGHSGRTDSQGGHRDNQNKSGLGYYHYHCGGYPAHLHPDGYCPYKSGNSSSGTTISKGGASASIAAGPSQNKIQLKRPVIEVGGYKSHIKVSWDKVNHAEKYSVYRATSKDGTYSKIATTTKLSYKDTTAKAGKRYYYKVKAFAEGKYKRSYYSKPVSGKRTAKIYVNQDCIYIPHGGTIAVPVYSNTNENITVTWWVDWLEVEWGEAYKDGSKWVNELQLTALEEYPEYAGDIDEICFSFSDEEENYICRVDICNQE